MASGGCCGNSDCATGFNCVSGSCVSWCGQQTRPSGVAASDYQCLDFENGLPSTSVWSRETATSGAVSASTARAFTLPQSLLSSVTGTVGSVGRLSWSAVGSSGAKSATISAQIYPSALPSNPAAFDGQLDLMCFSDTNFEICLSYIYKGTIYPSGAPQITNYTGLFLHYVLSGGAFLTYDCALSDAMNKNAWNSVVFTAVTPAQVIVNGTNLNTAGCGGGVAGSTAPTMSIGVRNDADLSFGWTVYFDNVVASASR